ncbi:MAG TPA: response regulator transcription factor [Chloroflexota bacterium]|nr:response regulator transcription factor [Chloroflexota bacterium]
MQWRQRVDGIVLARYSLKVAKQAGFWYKLKSGLRAAWTPVVAGGARQEALLSPRELEVALLVAQGLTNRQIADRLVISPTTVSSHVVHILNKLNVSRRSQIAAFAMAEGLLARHGADLSLVHQDSAADRQSWRDRLPPHAALAALVLLVVLGAFAVLHARRPGLSSAAPAHGQQLFALDLSRADAQLSTAVLHTDQPQRDTFAFSPDGVRVTATEGFPLLLVRGVGVADVLAEFRARELDGSSGYALQFRGCRLDGSADDDFYRVVVEPQSGSIGIDRARCGPGFTVATMLAAQRALTPLPPRAEQALTVAVQGRTVSVFAEGRKVAESSDRGPALPPGGVRLGVNSPGVVQLTGLAIYAPG